MDETTSGTLYCEGCGEPLGSQSIHIAGRRLCFRCAQHYEQQEESDD